MKRASTVWLIGQAQRDPMLAKFHWQSGYGVFSVSESKTDDVRADITNQEEHHAKHTFQDEYRRFLEAHRLEWDERSFDKKGVEKGSRMPKINKPPFACSRLADSLPRELLDD